MEYKVLEASILFSQGRRAYLDKVVQEYLDDGWELYGNPFSCQHIMCQAVIKKEQTSKSLIDSRRHLTS